jgi:hypothetical protein
MTAGDPITGLRLSVPFLLNPRRETLRVAVGIVCKDLRESNPKIAPLSDAQLVELARRRVGLAEELGGWLLDGDTDMATAAAYLIVNAAKPREIRAALGGAR